MHIKKKYNVETTLKPKKDKINIEALYEQVQGLKTSLDDLYLRVEILEDSHGIKVRKGKGVIIEDEIDETLKASSVDLNNNQTIIPISTNTKSNLIKLECRICLMPLII